MSTINATNIVADALVGNTSANAITVRGEGSATTSLQQGLCKAFSTADTSSSNTVVSSHNTASITDINTGVIDTNFTSAMSNGDYHEQAIADASLGDYTIGNTTDVHSTASKSRSYNVRRDNGALLDEPKAGVSIFGDLA